MSPDQDDGGESGEESGEQSDDQTAGQGDGQPQQGQAGDGQPPQGGQAPGQPAGDQPAGGQAPGQPAGDQPASGQAPSQPAGDKPAGGQAPPVTGQQPVARGPTAGQRIQAAFGDYAVKNQIKAIVGLWAIIGLSFGLTPLLLGLLGPGGSIIGGIGVGAALVTGPIVAALLGLSLSNKQPVDPVPGAVVSAVINYVGFVIMIVVVAILLMIQAGGGGGVGGGPQLGNLIAPIVLAGIPIAVAGGLATALGHKVNYPATREEAVAQEPPAPPRRPQQPRQPQQQP